MIEKSVDYNVYVTGKRINELGGKSEKITQNSTQKSSIDW